MRKLQLAALLPLLALLWACENGSQQGNESHEVGEVASGQEQEFEFKVEEVADLSLLRYQVGGFEELSLQQKKLVYYLSQAVLSGRDIIYDQKYKHNLRVRKTLEAILANPSAAEAIQDSQSHWKSWLNYSKRVWFSLGIHHHYSNKKFVPEVPESYFAELVKSVPAESLPLLEGESVDAFIATMTPIIFDPALDAKAVNQDAGADLVAESANNYYGDGVTQAEVEAYYAKLTASAGDKPPLWGLNSRMVKQGGQLVEETYKVGGRYGEALEEMVKWLDKAATVAENPKQQKALELLAKYFRTGDLKDFDAYNIAWVQDTESVVDMILGFIEVYGDAKGMRGAFEGVLQITDLDASEKMRVISENAQWFEDNSTIMEEHKKAEVKGVSYKMINVVVEGGDAAPATPIGINLPNSNWIRADHGSKSVSLRNIEDAYAEAGGSGSLNEFFYREEDRERIKKYSVDAGKMHTALHEVIGHASGKLNPGVQEPAQTLKSYASALEEGRADLVALYFIMDPKMVELGVMPSIDVGKAEYDRYIMNGLMLQLRRIEEGEQIEEAHMRDRALVARWAYEKGEADNVIEKITENGKTYFVVNDYDKLRGLFGELLREIQRIKSEGDYEAGKALIEDYGVKVNPELHKEVRARYDKLGGTPYSGFIQPELTAVMNGDDITDVTISYPKDFAAQMLMYGEKYAFLPVAKYSGQ